MLNDRGYLIAEAGGRLGGVAWRAGGGGRQRTAAGTRPPRLTPLHAPTPQDDLTSGVDAFRERYGDAPKRDDLTILVPKQDDPTEQIFVFFPEEPKVGVKVIKTFAERMRGEGVFRALVVAAAPMTPFARQCLAEMAPKYTIEVVGLVF